MMRKEINILSLCGNKNATYGRHCKFEFTMCKLIQNAKTRT